MGLKSKSRHLTLGHYGKPGFTVGLVSGPIAPRGWELCFSLGFMSRNYYVRILNFGWGYDDEVPFSLLPCYLRTKKHNSRYFGWAGLFIKWDSFSAKHLVKKRTVYQVDMDQEIYLSLQGSAQRLDMSMGEVLTKGVALLLVGAQAEEEGKNLCIVDSGGNVSNLIRVHKTAGERHVRREDEGASEQGGSAQDTQDQPLQAH